MLLFYNVVLPPSAPTDLSAESSSTSLFIEWKQSLSDVVSNYNIIYNRTGGCRKAPSGSVNIMALMNVSNDQRTYTLTGLQENIYYQIVLVARNIVGKNKSKVLTIKTLSDGM